MEKKLTETHKVPNLEEYKDEDGNSILDNYPDSNITTSKLNGLSSISYDEYVTIDVKGMEYIYKYLDNSDRDKFLSMTKMVKTDNSIVFNNNNIPHTLQSLAKFLNITSDNLTRAIKRMIKVGVATYGICARPEYNGKKVYMINPYIAKKRSTFCNDILGLFATVDELEKSVVK